MSLYEQLLNKEESLSLVGLGYVGMPIAVSFAKEGMNVIGFDLNAAKIDLYKSGIDPTNEVGDDVIKNTSLEFLAFRKCGKTETVPCKKNFERGHEYGKRIWRKKLQPGENNIY